MWQKITLLHEQRSWLARVQWWGHLACAGSHSTSQPPLACLPQDTTQKLLTITCRPLQNIKYIIIIPHRYTHTHTHIHMGGGGIIQLNSWYGHQHELSSHLYPVLNGSQNRVSVDCLSWFWYTYAILVPHLKGKTSLLIRTWFAQRAVDVSKKKKKRTSNSSCLSWKLYPVDFLANLEN